ncbi:MAG: hypothetical protein AAFY08_12950 [Planctomycetota bacterium]
MTWIDWRDLSDDARRAYAEMCRGYGSAAFQAWLCSRGVIASRRQLEVARQATRGGAA